MLEKTKAIVLHTVRYGESSLIVQCFTEKWGRQSFLMKGIRKSKKSSRANLFQPLFLLQLDIYFRSNRDLQWIKEMTMVNPMNNLQQDISKRAQAIFLAEILSKTLREEERNAELFQFLEASLNLFEALDEESASFHLLFLFQLTRYLGFFPENNYSEKRQYFDPGIGSFSESTFSSNLALEKRLATYWKSCFSNDYSIVNKNVMKQVDRNDFLDSILQFYFLHIENLKEIKSLEILRTVFDK